ncbi:MAG: HNH endonuclease [Alcaligenaceae bacterium]|nr:MAG: HNH endonuclease [Alcaligenaceae bacterium]
MQRTSPRWATSDRKDRLPPDWESRRRQVLSRDGWWCQIEGPGCTGPATDVDHIRRGDDHSPENLRAVCSHCHSKKTSAEGHSRKQELRARRSRPRDRHPGSM